MLDGTTIYPPAGQDVDLKDRTYLGVHEFDTNIAWSPDSKRIALVDCVYDWALKGNSTDPNNGEAINRRCALIAVTPSGDYQSFPLHAEALRNRVHISWPDNQHIGLEYEDQTPTRTFALRGR